MDRWAEIAGYGREVCATLDRRRVEETVLAGVPRLVGADAAGLYVLDQRHRPREIVRLGASDALVYDFESLGRRTDPFFRRVLRTRRPVDDRQLYGSDRWQRRCSRGRVLAAHGFAHSMITPLWRGSRLVGTINLARARGAPAFTPSEARLAAELASFTAIAVANCHEHGGGAGSGDAGDAGGTIRTVPVVAPPLAGATLTAREREVLALAAEGLYDHEIAGALELSPHTVKVHLKHVYRKLGVRSRVEAVRRAPPLR